MRTILYLGNKVSKHGYNKTCIETLGVLLEEEDFKIIYASEKKFQLMRLIDMVYVLLINLTKVDVIVIDTYSTLSFWYSFVCSQLARFFRIRYIPILHGGNLPFRLKKNPICSKMVFNNSYVNIAPSMYLKYEFELQGFPNVTFIPNSIEIGNYLFQKRAVIKPKLLWVRSFAEIYNPIMAIEVFDLITKKYPNAELCMIGPDKDGSLEGVLELAKTKGISVEVTGRLTQSEWWEKSKAYDIFINTTHFDNTPISVIECMALGLPVVSTNVGGLPYLLENNNDALLVGDNDIAKMVSSIVQIIENKSLADKLIFNARQKAASFDWGVVKQKWFQVLR